MRRGKHHREHPPTQRMETHTMDATEKVLAAMKEADEPLNAGKVVEMTGLDRKEVDKAMNELKKTERIVSPKRCYWEPKA